MPKAKPSYYAVRRGRVPGVYTNWNECKAQVDQVKGAEYKKFGSQAECAAFMELGYQSRKGPVSAPSRYDTAPYPPQARPAPQNTLTGRTAHPNTLSTRPTPQRSLSSVPATPYHMVYSGGIFVDLPATPPAGFQTSRARSHRSVPKPFRAAAPKSRLDRAIGELQSTSGLTEPAPVFKIWTDGAARGNGQVGSLAGYGVYYADGDERNAAVPLHGGKQTNQRAELEAVTHAMTDIYNEIAEGTLAYKYVIVTDSRYSQKCFNEWYPNWVSRGWKSSTGAPVLNRDIIEPALPLLETIDREYQQRGWGRFSIEHCRGHQGIYGNEMADQLANEAVDRKL